MARKGDSPMPFQLNFDPTSHTKSIFLHHEIEEFSQTYDYCMVFPMKKVKDDNGKRYEQTDASKYCVNELLAAGFEIYPYPSVQGDELLVLIRCPLEKLQLFADKINHKMRIDPARLQEVLEGGDAEAKIKPIFIEDMKDICEYSPYEHIYLQYRRTIDQSLYALSPGEKTSFPRSLRLKLIYLLIRAPKRDGGCDIELTKLKHKNHILAFYPLHDKRRKKDILSHVFDIWTTPWAISFEDIREYFGEKIALYYVFLGHYAWWLIIPSFVGLAFQLVVWGTLNFSHPVLPFYGLLITVWAVIMLEFWKRREASQALEWGMSDFEALEQDRPEFKGDTIRSYINGQDITYFPPSKYHALMSFSRSVIAMFIMVVIGVVLGIYVYRFQLQKSASTYDYASGVASILNTVQITIFNILYGNAAILLTNQENHRTDTMYEDSLIVKMFIFQFINSYASFFFLAFIAANLDAPTNAPAGTKGQCGAENCMQPLSINLATIFGSRLTISNFLDIFLPYVNHKQKIRSETKGIPDDAKVSFPEKDYTLMLYDTTKESIASYADQAVQFGFSLLFITALPCASFFSLLNVYIKTKFNMWKLATFYQRPAPVGAQDIGTWQSIFSIISVAAVITNAALICFTMTVLHQYSLFGRVWIFIGFQWVLISIQYVTQAIIPDVPESVEIQLARTEFINDKVIEKVPDEDFDDPVETEVIVEDVTDIATKGLFACLLGGKTKQRKIRTDCPMVDMKSYPHGLNVVDFPAPVSGPPAGSHSVYTSFSTPAPSAVNFKPPLPPSDA
jgi:anoctamin-10/anoctamin-7